MEITMELQQIVEKLEKRSAFVKEQLDACPEGGLSYERKGENGVLIQETKKNDLRKRHRLSRDAELEKLLLRKKALRDEEISLERNIRLLRTVCGKITEYSAHLEAVKLIKEFPWLKEEQLKSIFDSPKSTWAMESYEQSNYKPENKRQTDSRGLRVRSKSEVLITEKFYEHDIDFRYEQVLQVGDINLNPDFTIRRKDGEIFIWEHEGLITNASYLSWQTKKMQLYAEVGFYPWNNLIITYDNSDGNIDLRIIEAEIQNKLLI